MNKNKWNQKRATAQCIWSCEELLRHFPLFSTRLSKRVSVCVWMSGKFIKRFGTPNPRPGPESSVHEEPLPQVRSRAHGWLKLTPNLGLQTGEWECRRMTCPPRYTWKLMIAPLYPVLPLGITLNHFLVFIFLGKDFDILWG